MTEEQATQFAIVLQAIKDNPGIVRGVIGDGDLNDEDIEELIAALIAGTE